MKKRSSLSNDLETGKKKPKISGKEKWLGDSIRSRCIIELLPFIRVSVVCNIIASYNHLRYQLILPSEYNDLPRDYGKEEDDDENKPYDFVCPLFGEKYPVFFIEHPEDGEGQFGRYTMYRVMNKWISFFAVSICPNIGGCSSTERFRGVLWSNKETEEVENVSSEYDEDRKKPKKGYKMQWQAEFIAPDELEISIKRVKYLIVVIGSTKDGRFIVAYQKEVLKKVKSVCPFSKLLNKLSKSTSIMDENLESSTPFLLLDLSF
jgi:hypothetical protein